MWQQTTFSKYDAYLCGAYLYNWTANNSWKLQEEWCTLFAILWKKVLSMIAGIFLMNSQKNKYKYTRHLAYWYMYRWQQNKIVLVLKTVGIGYSKCNIFLKWQKLTAVIFCKNYQSSIHISDIHVYTIYLQNEKFPLLKKWRKSCWDKRGSRPPNHFNHFNNQIFPRENPVNYLVLSLIVWV